MDQDAFRKLLSTGTQKQNGSQHARSLLPHKGKDEQKKSTNDPSSKAAFKPRKVKKQDDSSYRDRAAERRIGAAGDFAEVEAVLESFEKQNANEDKEIVEERRKYLGGDAEHSVLVKGLDFALLEQTKARLAASEAAQDDEELEEAFRGAVSSTSPPPLEGANTSNAKKRTREDIVRELKNKRAKAEANGGAAPMEEKSLEEVKREGKFKPIGFKPIGSSSTKASDGKEVRKKKKKKVAEGEANGDTQGASAEASHRSDKKEKPGSAKTAQDSQKSPALPAKPQPGPEPEPVNEDFDIFADAGEYEGIDLGDDDEDLNSDKDSDVGSSKREDRSPESRPADGSTPVPHEPSKSEPRPERKWIEDDEDEPLSPPRDHSLPPADSKGKRRESPSRPETSPIARKSPPDSPREPDADEPEPEPSEKPAALTRLAPLASSAVPSIRDILAADSAREAEEKRKARKEKQKHKRGGGGGGGGEGGEGKKVNAEAKLNREYQKLKSYTAKKGGGGL